MSFFNDDNADLFINMAALGIAGAWLTLVAIWAGFAARPAWPWRVGAMFLALAALFPLEAYEPAALFLMVMPVTALACAFIAWRQHRSAAKHSNPSSASIFRFSLRDMLLVVLFVGVGSGMFATLWRQDAFVHWRGLLVQAVGVSCLAVSVAYLFAWPGFAWMKIAFFAFGLFLPIVARALFKFDGIELLELELRLMGGQSTNAFWLSSYAAFLALLGTVFLAKLSVRMPTQESRRWIRCSRLTAQGVLSALTVAFVGLTAFVYSQMLIRAPVPQETYVAENSYPRLLELATENHRRNPQNIAIVEVEFPADPELVATTSELYKEATSLLEKDGHYVLNFPHEGRAKFKSGDSQIRYLARAWKSESRAAVAADRIERATDYVVAAVELGNVAQRGGVLIDLVTGLGAEESGVEELVELRKDIPSDHLRDTLARLVRIDRTREDIELTLARERALLDRALTWQRRLHVALDRLRLGRDVLDSEPIVRLAIRRRDARLRLLIIELAIRLFQHETGRLPNALDELTPNWLAEVPIDPFSDRSFAYRRESGGFILYSVGVDGVDDGGRLMISKNSWHDEGFDYDLDYPTRADKTVQP